MGLAAVYVGLAAVYVGLAVVVGVGWVGYTEHQLEEYPAACSQLKMEPGIEKATGYRMLQLAKWKAVDRQVHSYLIMDFQEPHHHVVN